MNRDKVIRLYRILMLAMIVLLAMALLCGIYWKDMAVRLSGEIASLGLHGCSVYGIDAQTGDPVPIISRHVVFQGRYPINVHTYYDEGDLSRVKVEWVSAKPVEFIFGSEGYADTKVALGNKDCEFRITIKFDRETQGSIVRD